MSSSVARQYPRDQDRLVSEAEEFHREANRHIRQIYMAFSVLAGMGAYWVVTRFGPDAWSFGRRQFAGLLVGLFVLLLLHFFAVSFPRFSPSAAVRARLRAEMRDADDLGSLPSWMVVNDGCPKRLHEFVVSQLTPEQFEVFSALSDDSDVLVRDQLAAVRALA